LVWKVEFSRRADKQLDGLAKADQQRIVKTLRQIAALADPRQRGHALVGDFAGHWRYRVGNFRLIVKIEDGRLVIVVIAIGHRREVYR
jgi:mRNA interferase RelE/StbE